MSSVIFLPPTLTPPLPLTTFLQTSYPSLVSVPSRASELLSEIDAPRVSVPAGALLVASPFEPQPASGRASRAAAATASIRVLMFVLPPSVGSADTVGNVVAVIQLSQGYLTNPGACIDMSDLTRP